MFIVAAHLWVSDVQVQVILVGGLLIGAMAGAGVGWVLAGRRETP
jgi:hypothetical protein